MTGMFETDDFQNDEDQGSLEVHSPASSTYYTETKNQTQRFSCSKCRSL